ncbi:MAG: NADAR family protein [Aeromonas veronii]
MGPFFGEWRFLSNFHPATVVMDGVEYPTVEHAYQAAKSNCHNTRIWVRDMPTAGAAKKAGRKITVRPDWDDVKVTVMIGLTIQKFNNPHLAEMLRGTGSRRIEEINTWGDTFWGTCKGVGENRLGKILMDVRSKL